MTHEKANQKATKPGIPADDTFPASDKRASVALEQSKYTGRTSFDDQIRPVVVDLICRGVFKNAAYQDLKANMVLKALGFDVDNPPPGYSRSTIKTIIRQEWQKSRL